MQITDFEHTAAIIIRIVRAGVLPGTYSYMLFQAKKYYGITEELFNSIFPDTSDAESIEIWENELKSEELKAWVERQADELDFEIQEKF